MRRSSLGFFCAVLIILASGPAFAWPPSEAPVGADAFTYSRVGKPDPFRPFIDLTIDKKKQEEELKRKRALLESTLPLVSLPLESFRLVGIAGNEKKRVAVVMDPTGRFFPLSVGMLVGENRAKIVSIEEKKIILVERVPGQKQARRVEWVLKSAEDEGKP